MLVVMENFYLNKAETMEDELGLLFLLVEIFQMVVKLVEQLEV